MNLKKEFNRFNRMHFRGKLPRGVEVRFTTRGMAKHEIAYSHIHRFTACRSRNCRRSFVYLHPSLKEMPHVARMTLLHEMAHFVHIRRYPKSADHGTYFQREMKRLANKGAFNLYW